MKEQLLNKVGNIVTNGEIDHCIIIAAVTHKASVCGKVLNAVN